MVYARRPLHWLLATAWRYATPIILVLSAFWAFESRDDVQVIVYLLLATGYVLLLAAAPTDHSSFNRNLAIPAYVLVAFGLLITFGTDNRRVAPVLNQVLPHVGLKVNQSWAISRGDASTTQTLRLFEVTLTSRWARGVDADVYSFEFESGNNRYDNTFTPEFRGCDRRAVPQNQPLTCLIALELPQNTTGGTLIFRDASYEAWADVSF